MGSDERCWVGCHRRTGCGDLIGVNSQSDPRQREKLINYPVIENILRVIGFLSELTCKTPFM